MDRKTIRQFVMAGWACAALVVLHAGVAFGQVATERDVELMAVKAALTDGEEATLRGFVREHGAGLTGDAASVKKARRVLMTPLLQGGVSVQFRQRYSDALAPVLRTAMEGSDDLAASNAAILAGELATTKGTELLAAALRSEREALRFAALVGYKRTFEALGKTAPALTPQHAERAIRDLGGVLEREGSPLVLDAAVQGLGRAESVPTARVEGVRSRALSVMSTKLSARVRGEGTHDELVPALLRAAKILRDAPNRTSGNEPVLSEDVLKEMTGFGGDLLAYCRRRVDSGTLDEATRPEIAALATLGETIVFFAGGVMREGIPSLNLGEDIATGQDARYRERVEQLIGSGGILSASPFSFPVDRFR